MQNSAADENTGAPPTTRLGSLAKRKLQQQQAKEQEALSPQTRSTRAKPLGDSSNMSDQDNLPPGESAGDLVAPIPSGLARLPIAGRRLQTALVDARPSELPPVPFVLEPAAGQPRRSVTGVSLSQDSQPNFNEAYDLSIEPTMPSAGQKLSSFENHQPDVNLAARLVAQQVQKHSAGSGGVCSFSPETKAILKANTEQLQAVALAATYAKAPVQEPEAYRAIQITKRDLIATLASVASLSSSMMTFVPSSVDRFYDRVQDAARAVVRGSTTVDAQVVFNFWQDVADALFSFATDHAKTIFGPQKAGIAKAARVPPGANQSDAALTAASEAAFQQWLVVAAAICSYQAKSKDKADTNVALMAAMRMGGAGSGASKPVASGSQGSFRSAPTGARKSSKPDIIPQHVWQSWMQARKCLSFMMSKEFPQLGFTCKKENCTYSHG